MKRIALTVFLSFLPLYLTSCRVNWFDRTYEVPWWLIAVPELLLGVAVIYFLGRTIARTRFVCPNCHKTFHPKPLAAVFSIHVNEMHVLRCPHCKKKGMCSPSHNQELQ